MRRRPFEVRFTTGTPGVAETYPIVPARKVIPDWWRDMPPTRPDAPPNAGNSTARRCPGIFETMTMGWVLPLWMDIAIEEHGGQISNVFTPQGSGTSVAGHPPTMRAGMPMYRDEAAMTIKLDGVWVVETPPGYLLRLDPVPYAVDAALVAVPGAFHADVLHQLNPVFRYRLQGDGRHVIEAGTPLCHMTLVRTVDRLLTATSSRDDQRFADLYWHGKGGIGGLGDRLVPNAYRALVKSQAAPAARGRTWRTLLARRRTRPPGS